MFEILCNYLKQVNKEFGITIPWYIMTSIENNQATLDFFNAENYFGYPKEYVKFFVQDHLPLIDVNGKLVLEEIYKVKFASNGNGNLFPALKKYNILDDMKSKNLKWLFVGGVDNVLLNPVDSVFIGFTVNSGNLVSSKTLFKQDPSDKNWVFAKKYNKPSIIDCENFVDEVSKIKNKDGEYIYRETNMLAHIFNISALEKMADIETPYHRAFRKSAFVNYEGMKQVPEAPNIYKFEQFVFDAFPHFDNVSLLRVNPDEEFAPIKSFNGQYNPEIAQKKYENMVLKIDNNDD